MAEEKGKDLLVKPLGQGLGGWQKKREGDSLVKPWDRGWVGGSRRGGTRQT